MSNQPARSTDEQPLAQPARAARSEAQNAAVQSAALISRLLYAVLIVGFAGYYLDKALQIVRQ